jgi:RNA polymerase sigma-70 factor (ECF subfamily)
MTDPEAEFRRLYEAHRAAVHAYFAGRTADRAAAADLMQEVFVRVWQRLPEVAAKPAGGQRAWIFTVARNLAIDSFRHERTRAGAEAALGRERAPAPPSAATEVLAAERLAVVAEQIRKLPEQQRVTLALATAGGLTSADIAAALDVPAGTVRYRLSEARRTLAAALARYDRQPDGPQPAEPQPDEPQPDESRPDGTQPAREQR